MPLDGKRDPEFVHVPRGADVYPASQRQAMHTGAAALPGYHAQRDHPLLVQISYR